MPYCRELKVFKIVLKWNIRKYIRYKNTKELNLLYN